MSLFLQKPRLLVRALYQSIGFIYYKYLCSVAVKLLDATMELAIKRISEGSVNALSQTKVSQPSESRVK